MTQYNTANGQIEEADDLPGDATRNVTFDVREERVRELEQCLRYCVKELNEWRDAYPLTTSWSIPMARRVLGDLQDGGPKLLEAERIEELEQARLAALEQLRLACVQRDDLREALTDMVGALDCVNADEFPFPGVWEAFSHARAVLEDEGG